MLYSIFSLWIHITFSRLLLNHGIPSQEKFEETNWTTTACLSVLKRLQLRYQHLHIIKHYLLTVEVHILLICTFCNFLVTICLTRLKYVLVSPPLLYHISYQLHSCSHCHLWHKFYNFFSFNVQYTYFRWERLTNLHLLRWKSYL